MRWLQTTPSKQNWLRSAGLLQVLHRLTLGAQPQGGDDVTDDVSSALGEHVSISVRRQCARILAILSQQQDALVSSLSILLLHLKRSVLSLPLPAELLPGTVWCLP